MTFLFNVLSEKYFIHDENKCTSTHINNAGKQQCDGSTEDLIVTDKMHCRRW